MQLKIRLLLVYYLVNPLSANWQAWTTWKQVPVLCPKAKPQVSEIEKIRVEPGRRSVRSHKSLSLRTSAISWHLRGNTKSALSRRHYILTFNLSSYTHGMDVITFSLWQHCFTSRRRVQRVSRHHTTIQLSIWSVFIIKDHMVCSTQQTKQYQNTTDSPWYLKL